MDFIHFGNTLILLTYNLFYINFYHIFNMPSNPWIVHLNAYRKKHPNLSLTQAMKDAKKSYVKKNKK